jgi:hypothetical protein
MKSERKRRTSQLREIRNLKRSKTLQWKKGGAFLEGKKRLLSPLLFTKAVGKSRREE